MAQKKKQQKKKKRLLKRWKQLGFLGKVWRFVWVGALSVWAFTILQVLFCYVFNPPITPLMVQRFFQQMKDPDRSVVFERHYVSIDDISPNLINAAAISEDGGAYMYHHGFAVESMKNAYVQNKKGKKVRGGSTVSQQTAKNCFLPHSRNMVRKALEAHYTILIEKIWGKKKIMERYLNVIEFGDGIYGAEAASQHYFGHSASQLTKHEAALLAVCLPTPLKSNPARPSRYLNNRAYVIQGRMASYGKINFDVKREDMNQKLLERFEDQTLWSFFIWMLTDGESLDPKK